MIFFWNKICYCAFLFILFSLSGSAQKTFFAENKIEPIRFVNNKNIDSLVASSPLKSLPFSTFSNTLLPENFAMCTLGFFCRQEIKLEKAVKIPIRFRLGSLKQCNYYEGKQ